MEITKKVLDEVLEIKALLREVLRQPLQKMLTRDEVAELLNCSPRTVDNLTKKTTGLPVFKDGDVVRFRLSDINKYIDRKTKNVNTPDGRRNHRFSNL